MLLVCLDQLEKFVLNYPRIKCTLHFIRGWFVISQAYK